MEKVKRVTYDFPDMCSVVFLRGDKGEWFVSATHGCITTSWAGSKRLKPSQTRAAQMLKSAQDAVSSAARYV